MWAHWNFASFFMFREVQKQGDMFPVRTQQFQTTDAYLAHASGHYHMYETSHGTEVLPSNIPTEPPLKLEAYL